MTDAPLPNSASHPSRRAVAKGMAWSVPAVVGAGTLPAYASSGTNTYRFRATVYSWLQDGSSTQDLRCYNDYFRVWGAQISYLAVSNQIAMDTAPLGFAVVEMPKSGSAATSDRTTATLSTPVEFVVAYPHGMVNTNYGINGFYFSNGTQTNWTGPGVRQVIMTNPDDNTLTYDVFTFTWRGAPTQSTVANATTGTSASWTGTALVGTFQPNTGGYCVVDQNRRWYFANYYLGGTAAALGTTVGSLGTFTVANGGKTEGPYPFNNAAKPGWVRLNRD